MTDRERWLLGECADDIERIASRIDWYIETGEAADPKGYLRYNARVLRGKAGRIRDIVEGRDVPTARTACQGGRMSPGEPADDLWDGVSGKEDGAWRSDG